MLLAALCQGRAPELVAAEIGAGGSAELKAVVTESVNEFLRPIRARRAEFAADQSYLAQVLAAGQRDRDRHRRTHPRRGESRDGN